MTSQEETFFDSFRQVVKAISSTLDVEKVLELMVTNVTDVMGLKACAIRLLNPKRRTLELAASKGLSEAYLGKGPVDADQSIADALKGNIVYIENATEDPRAQYQEEAKKEGIASIVSVPMLLKGRVIGVLRMYTSEPRQFNERELEFAEALAEIGSIAIENAKMHAQLKQDYEEVVSDIYNFVGYRRSI